MLRRSIKSVTISSSSLAAGILVVLAATAGSAEAADPKPDKSGYSLFNPTPESELRDFAPDRPAKNTGANTIDAGHIQLETELVNYSRAKTDTTKTTTWVGPNPTARIGVTNRFEVQINWAPYLHVHQKDIATGDTTSGSGVSDLFVRGKLNIWGNEGGKTALAIIPYVKAGTAPEVVGGNRATEYGVIIPFSVTLAENVSLLFNTEFDSLKNSDSGGYHAQYVNALSLTAPVIKDVAFTAELWSSINTDPARTIRQYSFDTALAWTVRKNLQLDLGANFGLNSDTPRIQVYTGVATRF